MGVTNCPLNQPRRSCQKRRSQTSPTARRTHLAVPQNVGAEQINSSDVKDVHVTLPEGMTLNPSAASGLQACTPAQIAIGSTAPVTCPAAAKIGTVTIETDLPPGSLAGNVYLGNPGGGQITGPPFTIYIDAESVYGVSVRLAGLVYPNLSTGQLETTFTNNPPLPFSELILKLDGGALAPIANPLLCGSAPVSQLLTPYTGGAARARLQPVHDGRLPILTAALCAQPVDRRPARDRGRKHRVHVQPGARRRPAVPEQHLGDLAAGAAGSDPVGPAVRGTAGRTGDMSGLQPDRDRHGGRRGGPAAVLILRSREPHRPLRRSALRPVGRGSGRRGAIQPGHGRHARGDQRRPV